jgi:hypothetical protein
MQTVYISMFVCIYTIYASAFLINMGCSYKKSNSICTKREILLTYGCDLVTRRERLFILNWVSFRQGFYNLKKKGFRSILKRAKKPDMNYYKDFFDGYNEK